MPKTGSTSIQDAFYGYADKNLRYADLQPRNHGFNLAAAFSRDPSKHPEFRWREVSRAQSEARALKMRSDIEKACKDKRSVIFSGESVIDHLDPTEIADLVSFMDKRFDKVVAILYVRPLAQLVSSQLQQRLKMRMQNFSMPAPHYRRRFEPVINAVGLDNTTLIRFDRASLIDGDVVKDFAHRVGAENVPEGTTDSNESFSAEALGALYAFNHYTGPYLPEKMRTQITRDMRDALQNVGETKFGLSPKLIKQHLENYAEDVAWMEDICGFDVKGEVKSVDKPVRGAGHLLKIASLGIKSH
ncbi:hypothetical protein ACMA5I_10960 [Paracoccaceae bacterium GXU_MW_L88]